MHPGHDPTKEYSTANSALAPSLFCSQPCNAARPRLMSVIGMAEIVTYLPISSPFIRFAGRYVDDAFGVAAGYNFFVFEAFLVPFEIVACNLIITFWSDVVPTGVIIAIVIVLYGLDSLPLVSWRARAILRR